ncbi:uncharacterized protein LOC134837528 [Culicoides brevitarsis]|uniref:uncharacterized protein LOC134837528 n=1 Tax=Culicoides brevitarsis TaxID=469753 RepID=UPI00307BC502
MEKPGSPTSQQFCLRWHNHTTSLLSSLPGLLDQSHLTDVTLSAEGRTIKAHKIILSACSTFFAELFKNLDATPHQHPVIILPGTSFPSIVALMQFMYAGEVNVFEEQISNLLSLAETLGIKGLADFNNGKSPNKSETSLSSPQREKDSDSPRSSTPKQQQSPLESFFSRSLNLFPHMMPEPLNYSNARSNDILNRLTQSTLKLPHSPKSASAVDENANAIEENRTKSPFERRASSVGPVSRQTSSADIKRIDKIAETLRTVNKSYFEQLASNASSKACTMIPHSPPVSLAQMNKQPAFPPNFPGHFLSEDMGIRRTPENMLFEPQMSMTENFGTATAEMMMEKPALPKPANQKLYATCFICNKKLSNQYNLRVHLETHQNMRYACQVCNHVSRSKDALRKHVSYRHPGTSTCDPDAKRKRNRMNALPIPLSPTAQATMMLQQQATNMQMPGGIFIPPQMMPDMNPQQFQIKHEPVTTHEIRTSPIISNSNQPEIKSEPQKSPVPATTTTETAMEIKCAKPSEIWQKCQRMKRSWSGPLFNAKRCNQGNDRLVPDIDPGGPSSSSDDKNHVKHGKPVDRFNVKKAGNYILGPLISNSPIECLQHRLARKSGTNEFYVLKILTLDDNPKSEKEVRDMMQGKVLLHSEYKLLSLCKDIEGVIRSHGLFSDFVLEEKYTMDRSPMEHIYTGKILKRIVLVLDCICPHEFDAKSSAYINLHHYVQKAKLPERDILGIVRKICEIVERLHERNIIHSDLKLNNIVLDRVSNKVYITNFCLGRLLASDTSFFNDQRGSPAYIAPEILSGKPYRGKPCDMWALGVMFYTMIVGRFPFVDSTPPALFKKIKHVDFSFPPEKKISTDTMALIRSLLCLRPEDRNTASETLAALDLIIQKQLKMKRSMDQIVPDIDSPASCKPISNRNKAEPSLELSREPFSLTLEAKEKTNREKQSFIRPNTLSPQRYLVNRALLSTSGEPVTLSYPPRISLTHQINNLSLRTRLDDSWHTQLSALQRQITGSSRDSSPSNTSTTSTVAANPNSPTQITVSGSRSQAYVQSLFNILNGLFTRGRLPAVTSEFRDFNGIVTTELASKIANFLKRNCAAHLLVREIFTQDDSATADQTNVIKLFRLFNIQMEQLPDETIVIKQDQSINNAIFMTFMMQIAGFNNNYFIPDRN